MPRPAVKADLLREAEAQFDKLIKLTESMTEQEQTAAFLFEDRDKNLRDVLAHLYEWHLMVQIWHRTGTIEGGMPEVPGKGYTWKTLPGLNMEIWKKYQETSLQEAKTLLHGSHKMILDLIQSHTNDELFSKGVYKWTKSSTLGAYFVSCTSSHYEWAMKKIKKHIKEYRAR